MRRVQSAARVPRKSSSVPKTAQQRRRRNKRGIRYSVTALRRIVLSARWMSLALLVVSVFALVLVGTDEHFYLTVIPVDGTVSILPQRVVEASGLGGIHAFAADPETAARKVAELPGVIAASVTLEWPNRASIQIVEDSPVAVWREGGRQFWINGKGSLIPVGVGVPGLLLIESELLPIASDEPQDERKAALAFVPEDVLNGALLLRQLRPNIDKLFYRPSSGLSYQDGRGWRVHFGSGTDMQQKLIVYETIVEDLLAREKTPSYISVSNQGRPYFLAQ